MGKSWEKTGDHQSKTHDFLGKRLICLRISWDLMVIYLGFMKFMRILEIARDNSSVIIDGPWLFSKRDGGNDWKIRGKTMALAKNPRASSFHIECTCFFLQEKNKLHLRFFFDPFFLDNH